MSDPIYEVGEGVVLVLILGIVAVVVYQFAKPFGTAPGPPARAADPSASDPNIQILRTAKPGSADSILAAIKATDPFIAPFVWLGKLFGNGSDQQEVPGVSMGGSTVDPNSNPTSGAPGDSVPSYLQPANMDDFLAASNWGD